MSAGRFIGGALVPGYAFSAGGQRLIGRSVLIGCILLLAAFFAWLGYTAADVAFGLLLSTHVTSVLFLLSPWLIKARLGYRMAFALAVVLLLGGGFYTPARYLIQEHFVMPVRIRERVVVVQTHTSPKSIQRGDWIAYVVEPHGGQGIYVRGGLGLGPVLAVAGDRVRFTPDGFEVNGIQHPRLRFMPTSGEMIVAQNYWFVWPDLAINANGNMSEATISATLLPQATVSETQFIGKPFKRWFWRRQLLL